MMENFFPDYSKDEKILEKFGRFLTNDVKKVIQIYYWKR